MTIERKCGLKAERVPCAKANRSGSFGHNQVPQHRAVVSVGKELKTQGLTCVTGTGHIYLDTTHCNDTNCVSHRLGERTGLYDLFENLSRPRPLKREHDDLFCPVYQLNVIKIFQKRLQVIPVFIAIDSIDHEQIFIFDKAIKIRVVYCPAGFGGNERVLSPCNPDVKGFSVVAQDVLKKF